MKTPSPSPRLQVLACGALLGLFAATPALAVHDDGIFELDGNATDEAAAGDDWDSIFQIPFPYTTPRATPVYDGTRESFIADGIGNLDDVFAGSNKDIHDVGVWRWKRAKATPDKDNITNAYAVAEVNGITTLYFGADRFANNGDAALGFWFFQNEIGLVPPSPGQNGRFVGSHMDGDVLVQVDFVNGGSAAEVQIFVWKGDGTGSHGTLDEIAFASSAGFAVCTAGDTACAITNAMAQLSPWAYSPKSGTAGTFPSQSFYEGGINISELFGDVCFSTFMAATRTSHSETAELKDFALGDFNTCGSVAIGKACSDPADIDGGNPQLIDGGTKIRTWFDVLLTNDGLGSSIHDLQLREDDTAQDKENCRIVAVDGSPYDIALAEGAWVDVPGGSLAGSATRTVRVACDHDTISLRNAVSVRAAQSPGGDRSLTDSFEMAAEDVCPATLNPDVLVGKSCYDVTLNADLTPHVCVNVSVENTGDVRLYFDSIIDDKIGALTPNVSYLNPGESDSIDACYDPTSADVGGVNPGETRFIDDVVVSMSDSFGNSTGGEASADCPLCPTCPTCD